MVFGQLNEYVKVVETIKPSVLTFAPRADPTAHSFNSFTLNKLPYIPAQNKISNELAGSGTNIS